ncbi:MAG: 50S ribosomal protein L3 [Planctomycetes bacterium]|nr:50S ribosomal protein L3 [Planctomycetota bacterium]
MTQVYETDGNAAPVTVLQLGPCPILQVRTQKRDGYDALQLGFKDKPRNKASRAERGHVSNSMESKRRKARAGVDSPKKADVEPQRHVREFRLEAAATLDVGHKLTVDEVFKDVKSVDVIGTTKGRGTAGVIKRHGFGGMPGAHGAKKVHREPGSTSSLASNRGSGRPKKGKRLAGRYGAERVTIRNLRVVKIDTVNNLLLVEGAVPGFNGAVVMVRPTNKKR